MSRTTRDLRCLADPALLPPKAHFECGVLYDPAQGVPPCPCGAARAPFYATRAMEGKAAQDKLDATMAQFGSVEFDHQRMSRDDLEQRRLAYAARHRLDPSQVQFEAPLTARQANARADEYKHRAVVTRARNGYNEQQYAEHRRGEH